MREILGLISKIETPSSQGVTDTLVSPVLEQLALEGISYRFVEGDQDAAGYEIASVAQSLYINATRNKGFVALWPQPKRTLRLPSARSEQAGAVTLCCCGHPDTGGRSLRLFDGSRLLCISCSTAIDASAAIESLSGE